MVDIPIKFYYYPQALIVEAILEAHTKKKMHTKIWLWTTLHCEDTLRQQAYHNPKKIWL
jgi:hypothetical protein